MKIQCILQREGGTSVEIDGEEYRFAPDSDGRHVCDVKNSKHIQRFLSIPEGYQIADDEGEPLPDLPPVEGSDATGDDGEGGEGGANEPTVTPTVDGAQTLVPDGSDDEDEDADAGDTPDDAAALDRDALAEAYKAKFGQRPHGKWTAERIQQELEAEG